MTSVRSTLAARILMTTTLAATIALGACGQTVEAPAGAAVVATPTTELEAAVPTTEARPTTTTEATVPTTRRAPRTTTTQPAPSGEALFESVMDTYGLNDIYGRALVLELAHNLCAFLDAGGSLADITVMSVANGVDVTDVGHILGAGTVAFCDWNRALIDNA